MAKKEPAAASGEQKKGRKKSSLRLEVERVAKATGLPTSFIWKRVRAEQRLLTDAYKNEVAMLAKRVESITRSAMKAIVGEEQV